MKSGTVWATLSVVAVVVLVVCPPASAGSWQLAPVPDSGIRVELLEGDNGALIVQARVHADIGPFEKGPAVIEVDDGAAVARHVFKCPPYAVTFPVCPGTTYFVDARVWRKGGVIGKKGAVWTSVTKEVRVVPDEPPSSPTLPSPTPSGVDEEQLKQITADAARAGYEAGFADANKGYEQASAPAELRPVEDFSSLPPAARAVVRLVDDCGRPAYGVVKLHHAGGSTRLEGIGQVDAEVPSGPVSLQVKLEPGWRWFLGSGQVAGAEVQPGKVITWNLKKVPGGVQ